MLEKGINTMAMFSIIIPVYNVEKYLHECLDSVLGQIYSNYEIVLVDDGSTDLSGKICDEYSEKCNFISVVHQNNQGLSSARNVGINAAKGEYLVFLDSDDFIQKDGLEILSNIIEKENPDIIINNYYSVEDGNPKLLSKPWNLSKAYSGSGEVLTACSSVNNIVLTAWCIVAKRAFLLENNLMFYPGIKHEDELWTPQVIIKSAKTVLNGKAFYCYRTERAGSIVRVPDIKKLFDKLFIIDELIKFSKTLNRVEKSAIEQRCAKILTGVIRNSYNYIGTEENKKLLQEIRERIDILKLGQNLKYKLLYVGCFTFGSDRVSRIWNRLIR